MEWTHLRHVVCNWQPSRRAQAKREMKGRNPKRQGGPIMTGMNEQLIFEPLQFQRGELQHLGLLVQEIWSIGQFVLLPQLLLFSLNSPSPEKRLGAMTRSRLNVPYLFSCRQVTNITTPAVHDAAGATRCSQKERKCIFKVRWTREPNQFSLPGERKPCYVCIFDCFQRRHFMSCKATQTQNECGQKLLHQLVLISLAIDMLAVSP